MQAKSKSICGISAKTRATYHNEAMNILQEIVTKRKADIAKNGATDGFAVPSARTRKTHEFLREKGAILEIKRASPSAGSIAPNLDVKKTVHCYADAGAVAISCLTEHNFFSGTLDDLVATCSAVDEWEAQTGKAAPCVLRKDFLFSVDDVDVAFRCGADAVLLIARILQTETLVAMAQFCAAHHIFAFVEVRTQDDLQKLQVLSRYAELKKFIAVGVNSRDLQDFSIDLLKPLAFLTKIKNIMGSDTPVVFESGIKTPNAANFVGSLGFSAMLLGEAAAKNATNARTLVSAFTSTTETMNAIFWKKFVDLQSVNSERENKKPRPLIKICGITNKADYQKVVNCGADFAGFIFWKGTKRCVTSDVIREISSDTLDDGASDTLSDVKKSPLKIAVIADTEDSEAKIAIELCKQGKIDALQLHGISCAKKFLQDKTNARLPHFVAVNVATASDLDYVEELFSLGEPRVLLDAKTEGALGGTGCQIDENLVALVSKKHKLWLAGGITAENILQTQNKFSAELLDIASGVESSVGKKDFAKLDAVFKAIGK